MFRPSYLRCLTFSPHYSDRDRFNCVNLLDALLGGPWPMFRPHQKFFSLPDATSWCDKCPGIPVQRVQMTWTRSQINKQIQVNLQLIKARPGPRRADVCHPMERRPTTHQQAPPAQHGSNRLRGNKSLSCWSTLLIC